MFYDSLIIAQLDSRFYAMGIKVLSGWHHTAV
jgi:hypothetical protein